MKRFLDGVMTIVTMGALGLMLGGCLRNGGTLAQETAIHAAYEEGQRAEQKETVEREQVEQKKRNMNWEREQEYQEKNAVFQAKLNATPDMEEWSLIADQWANSELAALSAERDAAYAVHEMAEMNARVAKEDERRAALAAAAQALRIRETIAYCAAQPDVADHLREDICR
jgi:hypothetical protein